MEPTNEGEAAKREMNKGAWTVEEDRKLAQYIEIHGARRWKTIAYKSGLNRCGKSCRLRWLNYLRPNLKRGNISDDEEDLILRLHKLLGNRWSLIAGRLPGRTDNEIKNYWNSHLSKKMHELTEKRTDISTREDSDCGNKAPPPKAFNVSNSGPDSDEALHHDGAIKSNGNSDDVNTFFDFSTEGSGAGLDWVSKFLELDEDAWLIDKRSP